jgi:hypothetical protein
MKERFPSSEKWNESAAWSFIGFERNNAGQVVARFSNKTDGHAFVLDRAAVELRAANIEAENRTPDLSKRVLAGWPKAE